MEALYQLWDSRLKKKKKKLFGFCHRGKRKCTYYKLYLINVFQIIQKSLLKCSGHFCTSAPPLGVKCLCV